MASYATTDDLEKLYRSLTVQEAERAEAIMEAVSSEFRLAARRKGRDLDTEVVLNDDFRTLIASVVCDVTMRSLNKNTNAEAATQMSQGANGYTFSITPFNAGGGIFITRNEYAKLGLNAQRFGAVNLYE